MGKILLKHAARESPLEVHLERIGGAKGNCYHYRIGDTDGEIEIERIGPGEGWLRLVATAHRAVARENGRVVAYHVLRQDSRIQAWIAGNTYTFEVVDGAARRTDTRGDRSGRRSDQVTAPMPGTVLKIATHAGEPFEAHQPLIIMESMKMELTLSVPHAGRVKEITCREGQLVEMGTVLVRLEADLE